jgi:uncharacterized protein (DUF2461 family)
VNRNDICDGLKHLSTWPDLWKPEQDELKRIAAMIAEDPPRFHDALTSLSAGCFFRSLKWLPEEKANRLIRFRDEIRDTCIALNKE